MLFDIKKIAASFSIRMFSKWPRFRAVFSYNSCGRFIAKDATHTSYRNYTFVTPTIKITTRIHSRTRNCEDYNNKITTTVIVTQSRFVSKSV